MLYFFATIILILITYKVYDYTKNFFDDGIDYDIEKSKNIINNTIIQEVAKLKPDSNLVYHQFNNLKLPYKNTFKIIESILITNTGIFILDSRHYDDPLIYNRFSSTKKSNNQAVKLFIPSNEDKQSIECLYNYFPQINNLNIYSKIIITSEIDFKGKKPDHLLTLNDFTNIFKSEQPHVLSTLDISHIVGMLTVQKYRNNKELNTHFKLSA